MIVSCGEALVDLVPDPVPGGGPMNVSVAAARLGSPAAFVGRISTDAYGELIWKHLEANGVDLRAAERGAEPTARARVDPGPPLRFTFEGTDTADTKLSRADLAPLGIGGHIVHGGTLGLFRGATAEHLAQLAERHEGLVSLDPNVRPQIIGDRAQWDHFHDRWVAQADVYKASDEDLAWIFPNRSKDSIAAELLAGPATLVAVTVGSQGVVLYSADREIAVPAPTVTVVDTVGAGDTLIATLLTSLWELEVEAGPHDLAELDSRTLADFGHRAVMAAAIVCSRAGADPATKAELDEAVGRS